MAKVPNVSQSNVSSEKDVLYALTWSRWILKILGIWPLLHPDASMIEKILATISFTMCWSALNFLTIPMVMYILSDMSTVSDKVKMLGPLIFQIASMLKYFFLIIRHKNIRQCIRVLSVDWHAVQHGHQDLRKIMIRDATRGRVLSRACIIFMYCGIFCFNTVLPLLSPDDKQNVTVGPIPYQGFDIVFDLHRMSVHVFVYCAQCLASMVMFNITTAVCSLAIVFVAHACGQIEIVIARVESLVKNSRDSHVNYERHMEVIVKHHIQALKFSTSIDSVLREMCLIEVVGSTLIICTLEYYCMMEWSNSDSIAIMTYVCLLFSFIFEVFLFCYIGEQLSERCSKVGHASYKIKWYNLPEKTILDLTLLISMSHHPVKLTAGKIITLSFSSFGKVLKTSVAYLNLLRTIV